MDTDSLVALFGAGGPIAIILAIATFVIKEIRDSRTERTNAPRVAAESDSTIVAATKDVVGLIRSEISMAIVSRNEALERVDKLEEENDRLEVQREIDERVIRRLRHQIKEFRDGNTPAVIVEESSEVGTP